MKKLKSEELSRVLSAHAAGKLRREGYDPEFAPRVVCVLQAAHAMDEGGLIGSTFWDSDAAEWFDSKYIRTWTVDEFLRQLEAQGLA